MKTIGNILIVVNQFAAAPPHDTPVYNPSRGEVIAQAPDSDAQTVDQAVQAAKSVFPAWAETPVVERARILFRFVHLLEENFDALARLVTQEHGKTPEEARG